MTEKELLQLYEDSKKEKEEKYPRYLELMKKYFPEKLEDPFERYKKHFYGDAEEYKVGDTFREMFELDRRWNSSLASDYVKLDGNVNFAFLSRLKFLSDDDEVAEEIVYSMGKENVDFLYDFSRLLKSISTFKAIYDDKVEDILRISKDYYLDSKVLNFENEDILITDPCYVTHKEDDDWQKSEYGENFEKLGIKKYISKSTIYGDWGCTVFDKDSKKPLGEFCADAGMVSVFSLDEVKNYLDSKYEDWKKEYNFGIAIIENFTGEVQIKTGYENYEFFRYVEGNGSINFISSQTSL